MKKTVLIFFIIVAIILSVIIFNRNKKEDNNLLSKTEKEIEHLEERIIVMMNNLNNITLSDTVLIEEQTEDTNKSSQGEKNQEQGSGGSSQEQSGEGSQNSESNSSSSKESNSQNTTSQSTKYEIKNDSILTKQDNSINWEYIKSNVEAIHSTWPSITIDLHSLNVKNEDILNFGITLDQMTISAKQEDKIATLNNLASLYGFFPKYVEQISDNSKKINLTYTKTCVLNSYALLEQNKWEEMRGQITNSINYFTNILNNISEDNKTNSDKIYVLLSELNNSIDLKDRELFILKYKNVIEELINFE